MYRSWLNVLIENIEILLSLKYDRRWWYTALICFVCNQSFGVHINYKSLQVYSNALLYTFRKIEMVLIGGETKLAVSVYFCITNLCSKMVHPWAFLHNICSHFGAFIGKTLVLGFLPRITVKRTYVQIVSANETPEKYNIILFRRKKIEYTSKLLWLLHINTNESKSNQKIISTSINSSRRESSIKQIISIPSW